MNLFREILLDVWREACRHIEISHSSAAIVDHLGAHMPLDHLIVHRIEAEHLLLAPVAAIPSPDQLGGLASQEISPRELKNLVRWAQSGLISNPQQSGPMLETVSNLATITAGRDYRIAPLMSNDQLMGTLSIVARRGSVFDQQHHEMIASLQEPFAVALENDRRLHEMAALREAAEADRKLLLRRLGRTDITERIVGEHTGLAQVMQRAMLVSNSDAPVLLLGETGSGKEVVARAIHSRSNRAQGPFIRVNCGAIPPELIDSQLFGHEKGSFTGAFDARQGWFERADGGTLFLDEIGELPLDAQVRFLRVLQDAYIERVGGSDPVRVDVRIVAATHRDLAAMVQSGQFREDLWYRIAVFPILLPPLRDRVNDIAELANHFAERAAVRFSLAPVEPSEEDIRLLSSYPWPGNIRELGAVIDRAAILGDGQTLEIATALGFNSSPTDRVSKTSESYPAVTTDGSLATLDEAMRRHIEATLLITKGTIEGPQGAAQLLALNPHTLRARMRKLGIRWAKFRNNT